MCDFCSGTDGESIAINLSRTDANIRNIFFFYKTQLRYGLDYWMVKNLLDRIIYDNNNSVTKTQMIS